MLAVALASVAALFYINKVPFHTWFNNLDISHAVMAIAAFVFYLGALNLNKPVKGKKSSILPQQAA